NLTNMILIIFILSFMGGTPDEAYSQTVEYKVEAPLKDNALRVLNEKCNICHRRQNPRKVFTDANMEELAPAIYKQVFVKKRMPRGNSIKLTEEEQKALMEWIRTKVEI